MSDAKTVADERTQLAEDAVAYIREVTISTSGAADRIIGLCTQSVDNAASSAVGDEDSTPGLEGFLWEFWRVVIDEIVCHEAGLHDRLIEIMKRLRTRGRVGCAGWKVWEREMDWGELPMFGPNASEYFNAGPRARLPDGKRVPYDPPWPDAHGILSGDAPSDPEDPLAVAYVRARDGWLNICRFLMRIWVEDVADFELYGIWIMREGLEDLELDRPEDTSNILAMQRSLGVEQASVCVQVAGVQMYRSTLIQGPNGNKDWTLPNAPGRGGKRWSGVDGYDRVRWKLWKTVFKEVVDAEGKYGLRNNAVGAAKVAIASMEKIENDDTAKPDI